MNRKFGKRQLVVLYHLAGSGPCGYSLDEFSNSRKYSVSAFISSTNAINVHNSAIASGDHGANCASNCELSSDDVIDHGPFGPRGGMRYRAHKWGRLIEQGAQLSKEETLELQSKRYTSFSDDVWMLVHSPYVELDQLSEVLSPSSDWKQQAGLSIVASNPDAALRQLSLMVETDLITSKVAMDHMIDKLPQVPSEAWWFANANRKLFIAEFEQSSHNRHFRQMLTAGEEAWKEYLLCSFDSMPQEMVEGFVATVRQLQNVAKNKAPYTGQALQSRVNRDLVVA